MINLKLVIKQMGPLQYSHEDGVFVPDIRRMWQQQQRSERPRRNPQFPPLSEVIRAMNFVSINTNQCSRDRILLYGSMREVFETEDQVIVPLCYFNEERLIVGAV